VRRICCLITKPFGGRSRILVLLIALSTITLGLSLHFAHGQAAEVPRPGAPQAMPTPPAEVPRPGAPQPTPTPAAEVPRPGAAPQPASPAAPAPGPAPAAAQPAPRENLTARGNCATCHFNDQVGKLLLLPAMTDDMLVQMKIYVTTAPASAALPRRRAPNYREIVILNKDNFFRSAHGEMECIDCHDTITTTPHSIYLPPVKCEKCHPQEVSQYPEGLHGKAFAKGDPQAPDCVRCHGTYHEMMASSNPLSTIYRLNIPKTCASCHASSDVLKNHPTLKIDAVETYYKTVHGEGMLISGLIGSAECADCHNPHRVLNHTDPASSVSLRNIVFTCGNCHRTDETSFTLGVHGRALAETSGGAKAVTFVHASGTSAPACSTCHPGHGVIRINTAAFQLNAVEICGSCHREDYKTYRETYHGKVMRYGGLETARCDDCHGYHDVRETTAPLSTVAPSRIVGTCRPCHPYANEKFAQFIPHLEVTDRTHPQTFYPAMFMAILLIATLGFFVLHSILWLIRELADRRELRKLRTTAVKAAATGGGVLIQRFSLHNRLTHAFLFISVIGLAITGLPMRYHSPAWTGWIFGLLGGHAVPRVLHRIFAAMTILYAGMHFVHLWNLWRRAPKHSFWKNVFGPNSMIPNWTDVKQFFAHLRWFLFMGPPPKFGRWTYWEKFDYWAVFWGVAIIGASGLIMAIPRATAHFFPGWIFNVALIVHSDEALLAASFLFAIHFFHVHWRPAKFPFDHVMFTGAITREEMEVERPIEVAQLEAEGRFEALRAHAPNATQLIVDRVIAAITLVIGLALLVGMFWTEIIARFL